MIMPCEVSQPAGPTRDFGESLRAMIPVLTTERLTLRATELADFPALAEIATGPRSAGIGGPMSREDAWYEFAQMNMTWLLRGHGYWAVTETGTEKLLGFAGIGFEPGDQEPELGYFFVEEAEGKGFATEAVARVRNWGFSDALLPTLVSYIFTDNLPSIALAKRLGAHPDGEMTYKDEVVIVYRHPKPEAMQ